MRRVFVRFLEEIEDTKKTFRNYLTFNNGNPFYPLLMRYISQKIYTSFSNYIHINLYTVAYLGFEITGANNFTGVSYRPFLMHRFSPPPQDPL